MDKDNGGGGLTVEGGRQGRGEQWGENGDNCNRTTIFKK